MYEHGVEVEHLEAQFAYDGCVHDLIKMAKDRGLTLQETIDEILDYDPKLWTHTVESQWNEVE